MAETKKLTKAQKDFLTSILTAEKVGEGISKDDQDMLIEIFSNNPTELAEFLQGDETKTDIFSEFLDSPEMIERARELEKAGRVKASLETAVDLFNEGYNFYLAKEQQRVGKEELAQVEKARVPKKVQPIPELEDALRRARELGDPSLAMQIYADAAERSQLGAMRSAQLGSRGQAGALGAQAQAIHSAKLAQDAQLPLLATDIRARGLQTESPLIGQKQAVELANRDAELQLFPHLLNRQLYEEQMAGKTLQMGLQGAQGVISRLPQKIPQLVGNLYSNQYSDLPAGMSDEVIKLLSGLNYGR